MNQNTYDDYYKIIHDEKELKYFYDNILPPLEPTDTYFVSLSARNKYLSEEERKILELGRTEMFCKSIIRVRDWNRFLRTIRKFECNKGGYTTKNNSSIPEKAIVCYININPSNTLQAIMKFKQVLAEYEVELASIALKGKKNTTNISERLNKLDNSLMTAYQQSRGMKHYIDIDLDVDKEFEPYKSHSFKEFMINKGLKTYHWIDTKSGYHLLIKRDELKFNPQLLIERLTQDYLHYQHTQSYNEDTFEIIINKNEMIPVPGTYQGSYPVTILNKFKELE